MDFTIPVYIIIVTYNGAKWIKKCLATALASDCPVAIVIVDNGSSDNTLEIIGSFPQEKIHLIGTKENLGFGKANNLGIEYAMSNGAEYVYLLNQDAYLEPNAISSLVELMKKDASYAILSPMQYNGDGSKLDKNFEDIYKNRVKPSNTLENVLDAEFIMAAHWLVSVAIFKKLGLFNPIFTHYGEDGDFKNRVIYHGYKLGIATDLKCYHDREFRIVPYQKSIPQVYMNILADITDPREDYKKGMYRIKRFFCKDILLNILAGRFKAIQIHKKYYTYIMHHREAILDSRQRDIDLKDTNNIVA